MIGGDIARWAWEKRDEVAEALARLCRWLRGQDKPSEKNRGILIIGQGGAGKSTLGKILSRQYDLLLDQPSKYVESLGSETHELHGAPGVELLVLPGQRSRREATWTAPLGDVAAGKYRGIILLVPYGYDSVAFHTYKDHPLFLKHKNKDRFLADYLAEARAGELEVVWQLVPFVKANSGKLWLMTLVGKQDLWWEDRSPVEEHYRDGEYGTAIQDMVGHQGHRQLRHEFVLASLVISNFTTPHGELLRPNTAGYDHGNHVLSLQRLFETLDALRKWEEDV